MYFIHPLLSLWKNPWFVQFVQGQRQHFSVNLCSGMNQRETKWLSSQSTVQSSQGCELHGKRSMCLMLAPRLHLVKFKLAIPQWSHYTAHVNNECPETCLKESIYVGSGTRMLMFVSIFHVCISSAITITYTKDTSHTLWWLFASPAGNSFSKDWMIYKSSMEAASAARDC